MPFSRGEVVLVLFPSSDLRTAKRRPVLVVQRDDLGTGLAQVIVAMISSNLARSAHPSRITIRSSDTFFSETGLLSDSVVMTDKLVTVRETEINRTIARFLRMEEVDAALRETLGL